MENKCGLMRKNSKSQPTDFLVQDDEHSGLINKDKTLENLNLSITTLKNEHPAHLLNINNDKFNEINEEMNSNSSEVENKKKL